MKKIRLPLELYSIKNQPCMITICTKDEIHIFRDNEFTRYCIEILRKLCDEYVMELYCYCFMPDHIHFMVSSQGNKSIIELVKAFKSITTRDSRNFGYQDQIYQSRFHDHFIRVEDELIEKINYIIENPVRKGIVNIWSEHPFSYAKIAEE